MEHQEQPCHPSSEEEKKRDLEHEEDISDHENSHHSGSDSSDDATYEHQEEAYDSDSDVTKSEEDEDGYESEQSSDDISVSVSEEYSEDDRMAPNSEEEDSEGEGQVSEYESENYTEERSSYSTEEEESEEDGMISEPKSENSSERDEVTRNPSDVRETSVQDDFQHQNSDLEGPYSNSHDVEQSEREDTINEQEVTPDVNECVANEDCYGHDYDHQHEHNHCQNHEEHQSESQEDYGQDAIVADNQNIHMHENQEHISMDGDGNEEEKDESYLAEKMRGVELYKEGDIDGAIACWSKGLRALKYIVNRKEVFTKDGQDNEEMQKKWDFFVTSYIEISSNMSLAYLKKEQYEECIKYSEDVMEYDKENLKAFLRITHSNIELGNYPRATECCNEGLKFHPDNVELQQLKRKISIKKQSQNNGDKEFMKNVFERMEPDPRSIREAEPSLALLLFEEAVEGIKGLFTGLFSLVKNTVMSFFSLDLWKKFKKE